MKFWRSKDSAQQWRKQLPHVTLRILPGDNSSNAGFSERHLRIPGILMLGMILFGLINGADLFGATGGIVIYKENSFEPDSSAEIETYQSVEHFAAVDNVITTGGQPMRITSDQEPLYIPQAGDPDSTAESVTRTILDAEKRFPQFARKLEVARLAWAALPKAAPAVQPTPSSFPTVAPQPAPAGGSADDLHTKSGEVFQSWTVTEIEGDTVVISHADGISKVAISDLPDDLKGFPPDVAARIRQFRQQAADIQRAAKAAPSVSNGRGNALVQVAHGSLADTIKPWDEQFAEIQKEDNKNTQDAEAIRLRLKDQSVGQLVVKGIFLGMSIDDCYAAFQPFEKDTWYLQKGIRKVDGKDMLSLVFVSRECSMGGSILADAETKSVTRFFFDRPLTNFLFESDDLSADDFAQQFINGYSIPDLKPGTRYGREVWIHDDPAGWTLLITPDKDIDVSFTKAHSFGD
jgi:hypothetical protein